MIKIAPLAPRAAKKSALVALDQIDIPTNARPTHADKVSELVASIRLLGLQSLPTVVERNGRYMLVAGRHRLEALRVLGKETVPVRIVDFNDVEARLWTISENLHRNELNALDRAEQVDEFERLSKEIRSAAKDEQPEPAPASEKPVQVAHVSGGRGNTGGISASARELGVSRQEIIRARTIAALPSVVKDRARFLGVDGNQSALLDAAKAQTMAAQISSLEQRAVRTVAPITQGRRRSATLRTSRRATSRGGSRRRRPTIAPASSTCWSGQPLSCETRWKPNGQRETSARCRRTQQRTNPA